MKTIIYFFRNHLPLVMVLTIFFLSAAAISFAQSKDNDPVKVKIVKIVDGDTTTIEKTMDETSVQDFTKQFQNVKGKNVQVMITIEDLSADKKNLKKESSAGGKRVNKKEASSMHFNFDMDSVTAKAFSKCFVYSDSAFEKKLEINDSIFKNFPKSFDFNFDFNDEGVVNDFDFDLNIDKTDDGKIIIRNGKGKTIVINEDEDNISINKSEDDNGKTKTKTIVINDEKGKGKKKVIVSTSVVVMDMDDDDVYAGKKKKSEKEENSFSFYPNPSDGNFILELTLDENEPAHVKITDTNGKEIYNEKITGNGKVSKAIDLSGNKGTFIVTIRQGKKSISKKIIIE